MSKVLISLLALVLICCTQAFGAVAYKKLGPGLSGQIPVTSSSYTPAATGDQLICVGGQNTGGTNTWTASASTLTAQAISGTDNYSDGLGNVYSLWSTLSLAAGAQTFTWSQPSGNYINAISYCMEFSGASSITSIVATLTANPGSGAGAISGAPVTVATTDKLVTLVEDATMAAEGSSPSVSAPASSTNVNTYGGSGAWYWTGTGSSMTPTFTAPSGQTTDTWIVIQMDISVSSAGSSFVGPGGFAISPSN